MSGWAGFSDEELRRIQRTDSAGPAGRGRKPPAGRRRQQLLREKALQVSGSHGLSPQQQLNKPPPREEPESAARPGPPAVRPEAQQKPADMKPNENHVPDAEEEKQEVKELERQEVKELERQEVKELERQEVKELERQEVKELERQEVELREKTRLEQLQQEQKLIEEGNKRKKALLAKTIAEKSKQTQAEAVKLRRIQRELQALDDMVSNDIGILRGRIEQASWDYTAARKRYEKAEAEYVTAKLDLHKKTEVKEQLTEHLCAIIQQNELRKAHKLEELMQQLQLQATEEELERQREVEERRRNCAETHTNNKEKNDSEESQDGAVQSTKERGATEEQPVEEEGGENIQEETIETLIRDRDCKPAETSGESQTVAS